MINFIVDELQIEVEEGTPFGAFENNDRIRKFVGKVIGRITIKLYEIIDEEARRLNIYTYETRYGSKAFKIFTCKEFDFKAEKMLMAELLIFLINSEVNEGILGFIKSINSLEFDPGLISEYIYCLNHDLEKQNHFGELEYLFDNLPNKQERIDLQNLVGNARLYFDSPPKDELV